ncbi:MAG: hypothetical protein NTU61_03360 [Candidatus Altiarchaeota archaeon]|nr:hypothetical protein [Candidatus Altiarchaeota archaeon]
MIGLFLVLAAAFLVTYVMIPWFITRLRDAGIVGKDMNKAQHPEIPEMGGLAIVGGFIVGVLLSIALTTFHLVAFQIDLTIVLASLSTVLIMAVIGLIDDLFLIRQHVKALLPLFASLPLVAVSAGVTHMDLPILGTVDFGLFYPIILIPLAITGASNATNMLAGFNGLEAGLGVVMCSTVGVIAYFQGNIEAVIISFAMLGALIAFLRFNWFPAKILIGDVGTLTIGAVVATSVIVGNVERAGIILILPFFVELFLKLRGGLKEQSWCGIKGGKLVCEKLGKVYGLGRLVMHLTGGVSEKGLVLVLISVEVLFALVALAFTVRLF